jgi:uncharacterized protein (DUF342 family)
VSAEKTVVVQGKSVDEALQRAALLLDASTTELAYEVLQQGLVDQKGSIRIPYKLRVLSVVQPPPPHEVIDWRNDKLAPPFSLKELSELSTEEFFRALENTVALQPTSEILVKPQLPVFTEPPLEIRGDLTPSKGSINYDGDVIIRGSVAKGLRVVAAGSITVGGDLDAAMLEAGNTITVSGGILGIARTKFGGITCEYAQGAYIESGRQITVLGNVLHCTLIGGTMIDVGDSIVGGTTTAPRLIYAKCTGSETGVLTKLIVGSNNWIRDEAEMVRLRAVKLVTRLGEANRIIKLLEPNEVTGNPTNVEDRLRLWAAMSDKARLNDQLVALAHRKSDLLASIDEDRSARIKVADKVHPQTHIEIDDVEMTVKKLTQFVTFSKDYEAGAMRVTSFR